MCPICQCSNYTIIGPPAITAKAAKIIEEDYKIVKCNECKLYYTYPQINFSADEWQDLYDKNYFQEKSDWYIKKRQEDSKLRLNRIVQYSSNRIQNFLDIGCGEGYTLIEAYRRGWNTYGLDITDHRVEKAKNKNINFINSNLPDSKLPDNFFDIVYLDSVLEHLINPTEYLNKIRRVMKNGGILYIGVPNEDSLLNQVRKLVFKIRKNSVSEKIVPFKSPYHVIGFNKISLYNTLVKFQFQIIKLRNFACRVEFLKVKPFTKEYFKLFLLLPLYLLAIPIRKEVYLEAYVKK